jgi:transposase
VSQDLDLVQALRAARPYSVSTAGQVVAMDIVHPRVAGIDVHKKVIWVAVRLPGDRPGGRTVTVRRFATFWRQLQKMAAWLAELGVSHVAMESTGVYWWPVYHALAGERIEVCVCNAAHMRNVPGRKTDLRDCQWIAELHEYGLLRPSFIPAAEVAALRQRTRYRKKLIEQRISEGQRLTKVLEDAGIKIDSVASDLLGVSGRAMIEALIAGERNPGVLADLAKGVLRRKIEGLQMACDGRFTASHGQMCRLHLDARDHLTARIAELDVLVAEAAAPFQPLIARLITIPGIGQRTAEVIIAETSGDMARFATPARLAAWAGLAPGDNESAGKRKHAAARQGNRHLRTALVESAWATARTRSRPGARFRRLARRFGRGNEKKAAVAVAHTLARIAWTVMKNDQDYAEAGEDYYDRLDQRNRDHIVRHHQQALARLGYQVTLTPPGDGSPPPAQAA